MISIFQAVRLPDTWQKMEKCDLLLVRGDSDCGYNYQGKAYATLYDSLGDLCVMRGLVTRSVAKPFAKFTGIHAYNSPVSYNRSALTIAILRRAYGAEWANECRKHFWERILDNARPCYVIGSQPDVGLCRAGKMKGVPVYDLQHGVIADEHDWYGEKYRVNTPPRDLPDGFLCWDEPSAAALRKWAPQKGIDVRVVGNPWFLRFLDKDPSDPQVQGMQNEGSIFKNRKPVILVSLQGSLNYYYQHTGFNGVMIGALEKAILETNGTYNWCLRLHPAQLCGPEKDMAQSYLNRTFGHFASVDWRVCSELPLPVVLAQVDLHITDMSTVVVEAGWMGVYSALLSSLICPGGKLEKIYAHERSLGLATALPQETNVIKQWIEETLTKEKGKSTFKNTGRALHAFIDEIEAAAKATINY